MKRSFLKNLGLTDDQIDTILDENGRDLESAKSSAREEVENLKKEVLTRDSQLEELKKSAISSEELKSQIETLQEKNKADAAAYEKKLRDVTIDTLVKEALTDAKAKNQAVVKPLLAEFLSTAELTEGGVTGLDEKIKELVEGETTSFLFESAKDSAPTMTGTSPLSGKDHDNGGIDMTTATYDEMVAYQQAHPEVNIFAK